MQSAASVEWDVEGIISVEESVSAMLQVIPSKTIEQSGTFWTWQDDVRQVSDSMWKYSHRPHRNIHGDTQLNVIQAIPSRQ